MRRSEFLKPSLSIMPLYVTLTMGKFNLNQMGIFGSRDAPPHAGQQNRGNDNVAGSQRNETDVNKTPITSCSINPANGRRRRRRTTVDNESDATATATRRPTRRRRTESVSNSPINMNQSAAARVNTDSDDRLTAAPVANQQQPLRRSRRLMGRIGRQIAEHGNSSESTQPLQGVVREGESAYSHEILRQSLAIILYNLLIEQQSIREAARAEAANSSSEPDENGQQRQRSAVSEISRVNAFYFCGQFLVAVGTPRSSQQEQQQQQQRQGSADAGETSPVNTPNNAGVLDISGSINAFSRQFSQQNRQVETSWISPSSLAVQLRHPSIEAAELLEQSFPGEDAERSQRRDLGSMVNLPMIVIGVRDPQPQQQQPQPQQPPSPGNGWVMYVVGGPNTSAALRSIEERLGEARNDSVLASDDEVGPEIHGINGRFLLSLDDGVAMAAAAAASVATTAQNTASNATSGSRQPNEVSGAAAVLQSLASSAVSGATNEENGGTFGMALFSLLFGLLDSGLAGEQQNMMLDDWPLMSGEGSDSDTSNETSDYGDWLGASGGDGGATTSNAASNYELFLRLAELIGPARTRSITLDAVESRLPAVKYSDFSETKAAVEKSPSCRICLVEYEAQDLIRPLLCGHVFHRDCIDTWLTQHVNSCPLCRKQAVTEEDLVDCGGKEE